MTATITCFICVCFALISSTAGQLADWVIDHQYDAVIPHGVTVYTSYVASHPSLHAWLVVADLNKIGNEWNFETVLSKDTVDHLSTMTQFASDYESKIATNGGFFGTSNGIGTSYSLVAHSGTVLSPNIATLTRSGVKYYPTRCGLGIDINNNVDAYWIYSSPNNETWAYNAPSPNKEGSPPQPVPNATFPSVAKVWSLLEGVGGGPMLVYEGENVALQSFDAEVMWGSGVPNEVAAARTAIGFGVPSSLGIEKSSLLWIAVDGIDDVTGINLPNLADEFIKLGAKKACNVDGGGSTELVIDRALINLPDGGTYQRPLAASIMIY